MEIFQRICQYRVRLLNSKELGVYNWIGNSLIAANEMAHL